MKSLKDKLMSVFAENQATKIIILSESCFLNLIGNVLVDMSQIIFDLCDLLETSGVGWEQRCKKEKHNF